MAVATRPNPIHSGTLPWTTKGGRAFVNLTTGEGAFDVEGLVLNGGSATGTAGPITSVVGTLVCNPGAANQTVVDTPAADLTTSGNAELSFKLMNVPSSCGSPLFLIRISGAKWTVAEIAPVAIIGGQLESTFASRFGSNSPIIA